METLCWLEFSFSSKAKIKHSKELPKGQISSPKQTMRFSIPVTDDPIDKPPLI